MLKAFCGASRVQLDTTITTELKEEGQAREVISLIQNARKAGWTSGR